jgi:hypothetical protein
MGQSQDTHKTSSQKAQAPHETYRLETLLHTYLKGT